MKATKITLVGKQIMSRKKSQTTDAEYRTYFDSHVKEDDSGCYLWTAAKNNIGYGMFRYKDGMATAHRTQMEMNGYDITGKVVYHICDNYHCVNPNHLRIGTRFEKAQVAKNKGRLGQIFTNPKYFKTCPHCGKATNPAAYGHAHGDRCKHKPHGK